MKVKFSRCCDCYPGDVVLYNTKPCMVVDLQRPYAEGRYGLVCLEGACAGEVIEVFNTISAIDQVITEVIIGRLEVLISKEVANEGNTDS